MERKPHARASLDEIRRFFARQFAEASHGADPRLAEIVASIRREDFLPPPPWQILAGRGYIDTPSDDPALLCQNVLVALDPEKGINNGEPFLHAAWIGAVKARPGETVLHIGAGTGYYTAILARLVEPGGAVFAYEIEPDLARQARANLEAFPDMTVIEADADAPLPFADILYVNAAATIPPASWLMALKMGGRLIFPWQPKPGRSGVTLLVSRMHGGFSAEPLMGSRFIDCSGVIAGTKIEICDERHAMIAVNSLWLTSDRKPDETALVTGPDAWMSSARI